MAYRAITRDIYEKLVKAYRQAPGNHANAAREANVWRGTARKAWESGWAQWPWAPSIKRTFLDEEVSARARQKLEEEATQARVAERAAERVHGQVEQAQDRERARSTAVEERLESAKLIKGTRQNLAAMLAVTSGWVKDLYDLNPDIRAALKKKSPDQLISLGLQLGRALDRLTSAVDKLQVMAAREVGDPTEIVQHTLSLDGTPEDAARFVSMARRAVDRAARLGVVNPALLEDEQKEEPFEVTPLPPRKGST